MNKIDIKAILPALVAALVLAGCGGGGSSSNASAPANTTNTFNVTNESARAFSSVSIQTRSGGELYNKTLDCAVNQSGCMVYYTGPAINEPVALVFYDKDGKTVSAFPFPTPPSEYFKVYTSDWQTGFYLAYKLNRDFAAKDGLDSAALDEQIDVFFQNYNSPDGKPDEYEEIGRYFKKQLVDSGVTESQFLEAFYKRLANGDVATQSELPVQIAQSLEMRNINAYVNNLFKNNNLLPMSEAYANSNSPETDSCPAGLQSFLGFFGEVASLIPIVGDTVSAATGLAKEYCDGTSNALDRIESKLAQLQNSVDQIDRKISNLLDLTTRNTINNQTKRFATVRDRVKRGDDFYEIFLQKNGVKSLAEFFQKNGGTSVEGWKSSMAKGGKDLEAILKSPMQDSKRGWGNYLGEIESTTNPSDISSYTDALTEMCANPTNKPLPKRQLCNLSINNSTATLVGTQGLTLLMVKDIYSVLAQYEKLKENGAFLTDGYDMAPGASSFANSYAVVVKTFKDQDKTLNETFTGTIESNRVTKSNPIKGYFEAYNGIDDTLMQNMLNRNCKNPKFEIANITDWVYGGSGDAYIQTGCANTNLDGKREIVKARYYYEAENSSDVANVMGVLVPRKYVTRNCDYIGYVYQSYIYLGGPIIYPGKDKSTFTFNSQGCTNSSVIESGIGKWQENGVLYRITDDSAGNTRFYANSNSTGANTFYNWVRLKDSNGFNYAFYMYIGGNTQTNYGYACVTSDCSLGSSSLKFQNGPSSINMAYASKKYPYDPKVSGDMLYWNIKD